MPKIVDHDAYREDIANRAVEVFRRRGYAGVGMRDMAKELGMSKSALYHYYPSKKALFLACSARVAQISLQPEAAPIQALMKFAQDWESVFPGEVRIILDYISTRDPEDVRKDEAIAIATRGFRDGLSPVVDPNRVDQVLAAVFGFLLMRYFSGGENDWLELEEMLGRILN